LFGLGFDLGLTIPFEDLAFGLDFDSAFFDLEPLDLDPFDIFDLDFDGSLSDLDFFTAITTADQQHKLFEE
jgi:hypothetical protein